MTKVNLQHKCGVIICGKFIKCKRGFHDDTIMNYVEEINICDVDDFIEKHILLIDDNLIYTTKLKSSVLETCNDNLHFIKKSDLFKKQFAYLARSDEE